MRCFATAALGGMLLMPVIAAAQRNVNLYTVARLPDQAMLDRLDLKANFSTTLPVDDLKDGLATIQLLDNQLVAQLRSGVVVVYSPETGALQWSARPGLPYPKVILPVAADDRYVLVVRDVHVHAYDRATGRLEWSFEFPSIPSSPVSSDGERLYVVLAGHRFVCYDLPLRPEQQNVVREGFVTTAKTQHAPGTEDKDRSEPKKPAAPPAPGTYTSTRELSNFTSAGGGMHATPSITVVESVVPPYRLSSNTRQTAASLAVVPSVVPPFKLNSDVQATPSLLMAYSTTRLAELNQKHPPPVALKQRWSLSLSFRVAQSPVVTSARIVAASTERMILGSPKLVPQRAFAVETTGNISAPLAQVGDTIFVPTFDANFYAVDALHGRVLWRFTTDSPVTSKAMAIGNELFLTTIDGSMYRLLQGDGESLWKDARGLDKVASDVKSFVAANDRFVYVIDNRGRLTAIDRKRGTQLQSLPMRDFPFALANDESDRIYLAANDGSLVCLRDRNQTQPLRYSHKPSPAPTESAIGLPPPEEKPKVPFPKAAPPKPKEPPIDKGETPKKDIPPKKDGVPKKDGAPKKDDAAKQ